MKARTRKAKAGAMQRAWSASTKRHWVSVGRLNNLVARGLRPELAANRCIGTVEGFRFVTSPLLRG